MWEYIHYDELYHHGIKGQQWGKRQYQNKDGSLTPAGEQRYNKRQLRAVKKASKLYTKSGIAAGKAAYYKQKGDEAARTHDENTRALEKQAKTFDKKGHAIAALAARRLAEKSRAKAQQARAEYDDIANQYASQADRLAKKADKVATKKHVDIGKKNVNKLLKDAKKAGLEREREVDEWRQKRDEYDREFEAQKDKVKRDIGMK